MKRVRHKNDVTEHRPVIVRIQLILVASIAVGMCWLYLQDQKSAQRVALAIEAEAAALQAQQRNAQDFFATGRFEPIWLRCVNGWREELRIYVQPLALAWTREGIEGYVLDGADTRSLLQLQCSANGFARGPRFVRPLLDRLPAEAPNAAGSADASWQQAYAALSLRKLSEGLHAVELLEDPASGKWLQRAWVGAEAAEPIVEPVDAPLFDLLISSPKFSFVPNQQSPAVMSPLPRFHWSKQTDAAFGLLQKKLPAGAQIVELAFTESEIEASIEGPIPAFDGKLPAPYGDMDFDEYGFASQSFWYPREMPGFGCAKGRPLSVLQADFEATRQRQGNPVLTKAWYSCNTAYSNGSEGVWQFWPAAQ